MQSWAQLFLFLAMTPLVVSTPQGKPQPAKSDKPVPVKSSPPKHEPRKPPNKMTWWKDARFGMFIDFGPGSITGKEISWSRKGSKPLDTTGDPAGYVEDPAYDNLYKQFNPTKFNAKDWVRIAKNAGMKYIVVVCKHHDGFSMWDSKVSDYTIAQTPYKRDMIKQLADACHAAGIRFGVCYSPRDWHNPDYGAGNDIKYEQYMTDQITELLTHYGKVDIMWWDYFGKGDSLSYWHADKFLALIHKLQPGIITNNRCCAFDQPDKYPQLAGDFDTVEKDVGKYQPDRPWESCIPLSDDQFSWDPDGKVMSFDDVIHSLVECAAGNGNLMLGVGPMPDGRIDPSEVDVLNQVGNWLRKYGKAIYGTRGGPFPSGDWGGAMYVDNIIYLHLFHFVRKIILPPLNGKVLINHCISNAAYMATTLQDGRMEFEIPEESDLDTDTIIELTMDKPVTCVTGQAEVQE